MNLHSLLMIAVMAAVVIALRSFPFVVFSTGAKVPRWLLYLGGVLTAAAIAMLVVYSFYGGLDYPNCGLKRLGPALAAGALTVVLHWVLKNPLVSIVSGTALFMLLI